MLKHYGFGNHGLSGITLKTRSFSSMVSYYRKMAARFDSDLIRETPEALCDWWKPPEIRNLPRKLVPFIQVD